MQEHLVLESKRLSEHHVSELSWAIDVSLAISGTILRSRYIPDLPRAQASLYTIRDLPSDLSKGLINIPEEVLDQLWRRGVHESAPGDLLHEPEVTAWICREIRKGSAALLRARTRFASVKDRRSSIVLRPLLTGLRFLERRLRKQYAMTPKGDSDRVPTTLEDEEG